MNSLRHLSVLCVSTVSTLLLLPLSLHAQATEKKATLLGIGPDNVLDTYLSPEEYSGTSISLLSVITREKEGSPWIKQTHWGLHYTTTDNRANNANYLGGHVNFQYDWLHRLTCNKAQLGVGPSARAAIGGLYNTRNGNNPAQLQTDADLAVSASAGTTVTLFNKDFCIGYQATLPLVGAAFTPQYGQSYYEIFTQGNYDHNIVLTTPFNALSLQHMLSVDFTIRRHAFRIGYLGSYRQREANNLKYHDYAHMFILGYVIGR